MSGESWPQYVSAEICTLSTFPSRLFQCQCICFFFLPRLTYFILKKEKYDPNVTPTPTSPFPPPRSHHLSICLSARYLIPSRYLITSTIFIYIACGNIPWPKSWNLVWSIILQILNLIIFTYQEYQQQNKKNHEVITKIKMSVFENPRYVSCSTPYYCQI